MSDYEGQGITISQETHAQHRRELRTIAKHLEGVGLVSLLMDPSEMIPFHALIISFREHENAPEYLVNMSFIPVEDQEEDLFALSLLQFYSLFGSSVDPATRPGIDRFLLALNTKLPIGHVSIQDDGDMFMRYVHTKARNHPLDEAVISQLTLLFIGIFQSLTELVNGVATGDVDLDEALDAISIF